MTAAPSPPDSDATEALFPPGVVVVSAAGSAHPSALACSERAQIHNAGPKRQREYASGRSCAREALARLGVRDFSLLNDAQRAPIWPDGFVGSITHCPGYCGVVVAPSGVALALGLDAEVSAPLKSGLIDRVCTPAEVCCLGALPATQGLDWAKLTFSAKESFYKCYFPLARTVLGFQDVEIDFAPAEDRFLARLVRDPAPSAAGARAFQGRFRVDRNLVFTGVAIPARDPALGTQAS